METFDLIVIGGGPGGYTAALHGAKHGLSVALFEKADLGGTCLNRGCIPTKALLRASHLYVEAKEGEKLGIFAENVTFDMEKIHSYKNDVVIQLREGIASLLKKAKVTVIFEEAVVHPDKIVKTKDASYSGKNILIATGAKAVMPPIPGIENENIHSSDYFLETATLPESLIIVGGGVVGVEMAEIYSRLGTKVTILEGLSRLLPSLDKEIGTSVSQNFKKKDVAVVTKAMVSSFGDSEDGVLCTYSVKEGEMQSVSAQKVLLSIGRRGDVTSLLAPDVALKTEKGLVVVNDKFETSLDGIYAIGDAIFGGIQLAHVAEAQGENVICHILGEKPKKNLDAIPAAVFLDPEIATVGLGAEEAKEKNIAVTVVKKLTSANGRSLVEGSSRGFVKLVLEAETNVLLGASLMCAHAGEMIGGLSALIGQKCSLEDLESAVFPHPTVSETIVS